MNLHTLFAEKQERLDALMTKNNEGRLVSAERDELQVLVRETFDRFFTDFGLWTIGKTCLDKWSHCKQPHVCLRRMSGKAWYWKRGERHDERQ